DRLAGSPHDNQRNASYGAVDISEIDPAAIDSCRIALEKTGNPRFAYQLGRALNKAQDVDQAMTAYNAALEFDYPAATANFGMLLGRLRDAQPECSMERQAAAGGDDTAAFNIAAIYDEGQLLPEDDQTAIAWYDLAVARGNVDAMINLGLMLEAGEGIEADAAEAAEMYAQAAQRGDVFGAY